MTSSPRRASTAFLLALLLALLFGGGTAYAAQAAGNITCSSANMSDVSLGSVNPLAVQSNVQATLTYTCTNGDKNNTRSALLCFSIGVPAGGPSNPRQIPATGTPSLQFQLYQDAADTAIWGSQFFGSNTPVKIPITLAGGASTGSKSYTMYASVINPTSAIPGSYTLQYATGDTALTINDVQGSTAPTGCSGTQTGTYFPFTVTATVIKNCNVTAGANLNLGTVAPTATNVSGNTGISVTCSANTPYNIGLLPSNGNTAGAGVMSGTGGNASQVPYQLYSNAGLTAVWGNTATSTATGNGVAGPTSSAEAVSFNPTVWARVQSADFQPDTYTDTVTVTVNY